MMKKAVCYSRVSSDEQADGSGLDRQTADIKEYCKRNSLELCETITDDGYSAYKGDHIATGELGRFIAKAEAGKYKGYALLVEYLDRLSRGGIVETFLLIERLRKAHVEVHITQKNQIIHSLEDLGTSVQTLVESSAAREYSKKLSVRIGNAWAKKRANAIDGKPLTRHCPFWLEVVDRVQIGNKIVDPGRFVEKPKMVKIVREAFRLSALGVGVKQITRQLNGHGLSSSWLAKTLRNRKVLGEYLEIPNFYPQIITQSEWDAARAKAISKRTKGHFGGGSNVSHSLNLFSGLFWNVTAGTTMFFQKSQRGAYIRSDKHALRYDKFEPLMLQFLEGSIDWKAVAGQSESDEYKAAVAELEVVLTELDRKQRLIEKRTADMQDPDLDSATVKVFAVQIAAAESKLAGLLEQKNELQGLVDAARAKTEALYHPEQLLRLIKDPNSHEARLHLRAEIRKIVSRIEFDFAGTLFPNLVEVAVVFANGFRLTGVMALRRR